MHPAHTSGKTILVIGGSPKEMIDGVRYYANHARPEDHGQQAAMLLASAGHRVLLLSPQPAGAHAGVTHLPVHPNASASDLLQAAQTFLKQKPVHAVLHLATISSLKAALIFPSKLKIKTGIGANVAMEVVGNVDVTAQLHAAWPDMTIAGYDRDLQWFATGDAALGERLRTIAESARALPAAIITGSNAPVTGSALGGKDIIVTSGPTVERLTTSGDVITNISSGAQGFAIAQALAEAGARVTLISGPARLSAPVHPNITILYVQSAREMFDAVIQRLPADAYVGVAAVADFGMHAPAQLRLKENETHTLMLTQNPDILYSVGHHARRPAVVIGFAAETHDMLAYARGKLASKGADAICANQVDSASRERFGDGSNQITWITAANAQAWPVLSKADIGKRLGNAIAGLLQIKQKN